MLNISTKDAFEDYTPIRYICIANCLHNPSEVKYIIPFYCYVHSVKYDYIAHWDLESLLGRLRYLALL